MEIIINNQIPLYPGTIYSRIPWKIDKDTESYTVAFSVKILLYDFLNVPLH